MTDRIDDRHMQRPEIAEGVKLFSILLKPTGIFKSIVDRWRTKSVEALSDCLVRQDLKNKVMISNEGGM